MNDPALSLEGVEHRYGVRGPRWSVASLRLAPGQCATLTGPSGSGKTTLLELMSGIQSPQRGRIAVGRAAWSELPPAQRQALRLRRCGLVFQGFELFAALTVLDNILLPARLLGRPLVPARARALELAERIGLAALTQRKPAQLSHGERQRVAFCRALLHQPAVLFADEPSANLDRVHTQGLVGMLQEHVEAGGALVLVSHDEALLEPWHGAALAWHMADFVHAQEASV